MLESLFAVNKEMPSVSVSVGIQNQKSDFMDASATSLSWRPDSWQFRLAQQQPLYAESQELKRVLEHLTGLPPLITSAEILALKQKLANVAEGKAFLLQAGECAENFTDCNSVIISNRLKVLLQMSLVLSQGLRMPIVRIGRFAGQYAKPRSSDVETRHGITLPSYRGDSINSTEFSPAARRFDPQRLLAAHAHSAMTLNFVRALIAGGFADLHCAQHWDLTWGEGHPPLVEDYHQIIGVIEKPLPLKGKIAGEELTSSNTAGFYISHEALLLHYEQALTREVPRQRGWFNLSTHFPWIGIRTSNIDGAHIEYCRGIRNPIGLKVGPDTKPDQLVDLIKVLNPFNEKGRLTLIHRMGAAEIAKKLPPLLERIKFSGHSVVWCCDPMHGNTETLENGVKTRRFDNICSEITQAFDLHREYNTWLGGVHLELTGENVTECTGGAGELTEEDLPRAYKSTVDPRLNYQQSLELAMLIARKGAMREN